MRCYTVRYQRLGCHAAVEGKPKEFFEPLMPPESLG